MAAGLVKERKNLKLIYQDGLDGDPNFSSFLFSIFFFFPLNRGERGLKNERQKWRVHLLENINCSNELETGGSPEGLSFEHLCGRSEN